MTTITAPREAPAVEQVSSRRTPPVGADPALIAIAPPGWYDDLHQPLAEHYFDGRVWLASRWKGFPQITPAPGAAHLLAQLAAGPEVTVPQLMPAPAVTDDHVDEAVPTAVVATPAEPAATPHRGRRRHLALVAGYVVGVGLVAILSGEVVLILG